MVNSYAKRFQLAIQLLESEEVKRYSRFPEMNFFLRNRKIPLPRLILSILSKKGLTTAIELRQFFSQTHQNDMSISKQGYLKQRRKLNHEVFTFLNRQYLKEFYQSEEAVLWNGCFVFAVDGTKVEVPNSPENKKNFGESRNHSEQVSVRAMLSTICDVYNDFILNIQIDSITASERLLAAHHVNAIKGIIADHPSIVLFDHGYPSLLLIHILEMNAWKGSRKPCLPLLWHGWNMTSKTD